MQRPELLVGTLKSTCEKSKIDMLLANLVRLCNSKRNPKRVSSTTNSGKTDPTHEIPMTDAGLSAQAGLCVEEKLPKCAKSNRNIKGFERERLCKNTVESVLPLSNTSDGSPSLEHPDTGINRSTKTSDCKESVKANLAKSNINDANSR